MSSSLRFSQTDRWQSSIEKVIRNVVSICYCHTINFDGEPACSSEATGFVVDPHKGYILTNRHVVGAGPFWGSVVFENHDEVDVYCVYCDPVHDFGFLRFNPKAVKHTHCDGLQLRPDLAAVGLETRVVGNDAGEKVSILPAIISRLDRNAPTYGQPYCDFNTCYYQANASATGGSSGSPVVNIDGFVVALQAGGRTDEASTDFFLPLDRPLRALRCLQADEPIPRGDIQCQFLLKPFDECKRLGLTDTWEATVRQAFPSDNNLLVAETVLPNGPADDKIEEGDIITKINGEIITKFERFDDILDSNVHGTIRLQLQRGGEDLQFEIEVGDLHLITPDRFVSFAGAILHTLSYQMARRYAVACQGVFVSGVAGASSFFHKHMFYNMGLATPALLPVVSQVREGIIPSLRMLPVQFSSIGLDKAKPRGLSDDWIGKITRANKTRLFMVSRRTVERNQQKTPLLEGDLLLTLNGRLVVEVFDLNDMYSHETLDVVVIREGREHRLKVNTVTTDDAETDHAISFCGAILQRPYLAVRQQLSELHSDVYITFNDLGSPADHFRLKPTDFITHINGHPTPNLKAFSEIIKKIPDNTYFRLKVVTSNNVRKVVTMKKNEHYFPMKEWIKDSCGWKMKTFRTEVPNETL
ncbi:Pro-apoptotic serine protease [Colletotrichum sp. SAR 10_99]|nr:Pro-apoptotic serine protease [Colletotrichum sp. SAR 10_99]